MWPQDESRRKMAALIGGSSRTAICQGSGPETYRTAVWWTGNSAHHGMDYWNFSGKGRLHGELGMLTFVVPVSIAADIAARAWASWKKTP